MTGLPGTFLTVREVNDSGYIRTAPNQSFAGAPAPYGERYTVVLSTSNITSVTGLDFGSFPSTISGTAGPDVIRARLDCCGGRINFWVNTADTEDPTYSIPRTLLNSLNIEGGAGDDRIILDYSKGILAPTAIQGGMTPTNITGAAGQDTLVLLGGKRDEPMALLPGAAVDRAGISAPSGLVNISSFEAFQADGGGGYDSIRHVLPIALEIIGPQELSELRVDDTHRARLANGANILTSALTLGGTAGAWTSTLDIRNSALVLRSSTANRLADLARVLDQVRSGRNAGAWNGTGITTSAATPITTIAVALNERRDGTPLLRTFNGHNLDTNAVLVKHTYHGDMNFDGRVNIDDYFAVDLARTLGGSGWTAGDFDDSGGRADAQDLMMMDRAFLGQSGPMGAAPAEAPSPAGQPAAPLEGVAWSAQPILPEDDTQDSDDDDELLDIQDALL
jgi:hypothetical protein